MEDNPADMELVQPALRFISKPVDVDGTGMANSIFGPEKRPDPHAVGHPLLNDAGELVEFRGIAMDVTEPGLAEDAAPIRRFVE